MCKRAGFAFEQSHVRDEADYNIGVVAATQEVIRIAEEGRLIGIVSHMKALGPDQWGLSYAMTRKIEDDFPEARRTLYVGMTRARDRLVLTRADQRDGKPSGGSRFLEELELVPVDLPEGAGR